MSFDTQLTAKLDRRQKECKAALANLSKRYDSAKIDRTTYPLGKQHLEVIKSLRQNKEIVISCNKDKCQHLDSVEMHGNTLQEERALQAFLFKAHKDGNIAKIYDRIRPVGSSRPRMYGLPKLHK